VSEELVHLRAEGGIARITLDSPHNRNALSRRLVGELSERLDAALADAEVRAIVLTHTGTVFCAGADLKERAEASTQAPPFERVLERIREAPKPVLVRVAGHVRAGGMGLVAACDLAVASDEATFATTEVRLGLAPAIIAVTLLEKLHRTDALELFLTAEPVPAARAREMGLLTAVAAAGELDAVVAGYEQALLRASPQGLAETKRIVRTLGAIPPERRFEEMARLSARLFASEEAQEGMRAFLEKRPPRWKGGAG
jgi:methylglutaconyl-CoA hydratase